MQSSYSENKISLLVFQLLVVHCFPKSFGLNFDYTEHIPLKCSMVQYWLLPFNILAPKVQGFIRSGCKNTCVKLLNAESNSWIGTERRRTCDSPLEYSPAIVHGR